MTNPVIQLLVLAAIAIFLILRLRSVLGTREGFEKPPVPRADPDSSKARQKFEVIEGGPDRDITDHVAEDSAAAAALTAMKKADPTFNVTEFLQGARGAYEMILMAFEKGDLDQIKSFLSDDVYEAFAGVVEARHAEGITIDATFVGISDLALVAAEFDETTREGEVSVKFVGEMTSVVRNAAGEIVEGSATEIKRQRDIWTFARTMGTNDPNWLLVATGE